MEDNELKAKIFMHLDQPELKFDESSNIEEGFLPHIDRLRIEHPMLLEMRSEATTKDGIDWRGNAVTPVQ